MNTADTLLLMSQWWFEDDGDVMDEIKDSVDYAQWLIAIEVCKEFRQGEFIPGINFERQVWFALLIREAIKS